MAGQRLPVSECAKESGHYPRALSAEEVAVLAGGNSAYDGLNRRIVHAERKGKGTGSFSVTASHQPARREERKSCLSCSVENSNYFP